MNNIHAHDYEAPLDGKTLNTIQSAKRRDFPLIMDEIKAVGNALDSKISEETDPKIKLELNSLNEEISQALSYLRGELKSIAKARLDDNHPRVWAVNKIFEELKSNLVQAYTIVTEQQEAVPQSTQDQELTDTEVANLLNPNDAYPDHNLPDARRRKLPMDKLPYVDKGNLPFDPLSTFDIQSQPDTSNSFIEPVSLDNRDSTVNLSPEIKALQATVERLQAEVASMKEQFDQYTNRPTYNNLLQADSFRQVSPDGVEDKADQTKKDKSPDKKQDRNIANNQLKQKDVDTKPATPDASNHEQSFKNAIDDILQEFGQNKLPNEFEVELDIFPAPKDPSLKDLSLVEEDFLTRLRTFLSQSKRADPNANTTQVSDRTISNVNNTVDNPLFTRVSPYMYDATQPVSQDTVQSNRVDDQLVTQKGYLMEIFDKKTQGLSRISFQNILANSPSIAQKHEQLVKASADNTDMATFKNLLYGLMAEIVRIDSMALPQNITQQGPSYNTMPTPITPASV